jgi:hypothetical protein
MPFSHTLGAYNIEGTLRAWALAQLTANRPPLAASAPVIFDREEQPLTPPCWSVDFLGGDSDRPYQGSHVDGGLHGHGRWGVMDVSCWVSRSLPGWRGQLAQLQDAVTKAVETVMATGGAVVIRDFYGSADTPAAVTYRICIERADVQTPAPDPNPDIERRRIVISYSWVERA